MVEKKVFNTELQNHIAQQLRIDQNFNIIFLLFSSSFFFLLLNEDK